MLASPLAKVLFLETVEKLRRKYKVLVLDMVVMDNHIHLILQPLGETGLSEIMKWLLGVYTMSYNRVFKTWGRVWGGRYYSRPLGGLRDLEATIEYVDRNPVRAFLVERPEDWEWGGLYLHRCGRPQILGEPPTWLMLIAPKHGKIYLGV